MRTGRPSVRRRAPRNGGGSSRGPRLAHPLLLLAFALAAPGAPRAEPDYRGPLLYGLDPVVRATDDPRLLGVERQVLRQRLEGQGVRVDRDGPVRPTLATAIRRRWRERSSVDLERREQVVEINGPLGVLVVLEYPSFLYLFPARESLPGGFSWFPPRRVEDPDVDIFVDDLEIAFRRAHGVISRTGRFSTLDRAGGGKRTGDDDGLINLTIPVKLPRTLEKIIGRGEKTNIRISGRARIALTGESSITKPFLGNERIQSQSLFPTLDMEQELQISLSGTIGEKIIIEVDHNSAALGPDATKIKLMYQGDEDEIIRTIETGDVGLTLPGSQLLGYNSNQSGLFGLKVTGQVGPADFTVVATKQKAESTSQTFSSSGGQITEHVVLSGSYLRNRFFRLTSDREASRIPMNAIVIETIRVYEKVQAQGNIQEGELENVAAYADTLGRWDGVDFAATPAAYGGRWREIPINTDPTQPLSYSLLLDVDGYLWGIDLGRDVGDNAELACTFEYRISETETRRVGDDLTEPRQAEIFDNGQPVEGSWYRLKLLKAATSARNPWSHALMIRQIYSLGGGNISPESFNLRVERDDTSDQPRYDENQVDYLRIFGLDRGDDFGEGEPDERPDIQRDRLFDLRKGLLLFPESFRRPFAAGEAKYDTVSGFADFAWAGSFLANNQASILYEVGADRTDLTQNSYFRFVAEHSSASNVISLNTSNIEEGSEVVKVDGQTLTRDQDYDIDYTFGEITLKEGSFTLTADSKITVTFSATPFIGGGATSLVGANVNYNLGQESNVSSTVLYQTTNIVGEKAKLGEEPSKNLVGNLNLQHAMRPGILTKFANFLSRLNTERDSELRFSGEIAASVPNPNTKGNAYLEDFEGVDNSNTVSLVRTAWTMPSKPIAGPDGSLATAPSEEDRLRTIRWFLPKERVLRRYLNPDLVNRERDETQPAMDLYLRNDDGGWDPDKWGGILRGVSATGLDLQRAQFIEIWVNDKIADRALRSGRLHIDFGVISEDGYWPVDPETGDIITGTQQDEDADRDKIFKQEEDTGLGGINDANDFRAEYVGPENPYPDINSTKRNNNWDIEDANRNNTFEQTNEYFTVTIDLAETEALVDVREDYTNLGDMPSDAAWRKYRIPLSAAQPVTTSGFEPELDRVKHVRIWFEDDTPRADGVVWLQLSDLRFLGSRWEREGIRDVATEERLLGADLPAGDAFFLGEVNNKENPDYVPPYTVRVENDIPEKEQALVVDYQNLDRDHLLRISKQVSLQGDDYTGYEDLNWFWFNPDHRTADMDLFFRVGADTLNFYEVRYRFSEGRNRTGWKAMTVDIADLAAVKNGALDADGNRVGQVSDVLSGDSYDVRVVGRPDMRRVKRYYFVVANNALSAPVSGRVFLNDVRLLGVKRIAGFAERAGVRLNMANVFQMNFDWSHQDPEFHGLDRDRGSGIDNRDWTLGMNFNVENFIPLLGFKLPVNLSRRRGLQRPKYEINSDIEIRDEDVRNALSSTDGSESFSVRLSHQGSQSALLRYLVDPWSFSVNGSESFTNTPLQETKNKTISGDVNYDLRLPGRTTLGGVPLLGKVPIVKAVSLLPSRFGMNGRFQNSYGASVTINNDGSRTARPETRSKPLDLSASLDYDPLSILSLGASGASKRDMMREQEVAGVNIGEETLRSYSLRMTILPPRAKELPQIGFLKPLRSAARLLNATRPSVQFNGSFNDDHNPSLRREGDPPDIRSVSNGGKWELRFSFPLGDLGKKWFPERQYSEAERQRILREQQRVEDRAARRGEEETGVTLTDEEIAGLTPDQIEELRERKLLEAAERRRQEEEQRRRDREALGGEEEGGFSIPNPLNVLAAGFRNLQPIQLTFTDNRQSAYARLLREAPFWYKTGLVNSLDAADSLFSSSLGSKQTTVQLSGSTKLHRNLTLDLKFRETQSERDQNEQVTGGFQQDWPDGQVSLSGVERWPIFGGGNRGGDEGWFKSSSLSVSYRRSKIVNNIQAGFYNPSTSIALSPRLTATFHSGLTATASVNKSGDEVVNLGSTQRKNRLRLALNLRHQFRAQGFLARLGLYRPGANPTVTMDLDISYDTNRSVRIDASGVEGTTTGNNRLNINPRFSYNITQNLTGTARLIYGRSSNIQTGQTTTTLGLGLEVTFVF